MVLERSVQIFDDGSPWRSILTISGDKNFLFFIPNLQAKQDISNKNHQLLEEPTELLYYIRIGRLRTNKTINSKYRGPTWNKKNYK
ncbi:MAG: hypothetical protein COA78_28485 [Blastopirellula sp.]|nr:MAG: hypothetical protein COA78_28485 [Blastopirellula sp.]